MSLPRHLKGDLAGAVSAAVVSLPMAAGYGMVAFASLGPAFAPQAAMAGIYSAVFSCLFAALFGGSPLQISGPKAPLTLVATTVVAGLVASPRLFGTGPVDPALVVGLLSLSVFSGGLLQLVFGTLRLGNLVKYVPYPVVAGFTNGIAILLVAKQLQSTLGLDLSGLPASLPRVDSLAAAVGLSSVVSVFAAKRWLRRLPGSLAGVLVGCAVYYAAGGLGWQGGGGVIGAIPSGWPKLAGLSGLLPLLDWETLSPLLPRLLLAGVALGLVGSLESLLSAVACDNVTGNRHDANRELRGQGIGNVVCAFFGALPGAGSVPRALANYRAGGQTRLSGVACSLLVLSAACLFGPLIGQVPVAAFSGVVLTVGLDLFDRWSLRLARQVMKADSRRRDVALDVLVTAAVAVVTVSANLVAAVGVGVAVAAILFVVKTGNSVIRRRYTGEQVRSRRVRSEEHAEILDREGRRICVFELQGPVFFGSAERLARQLEREAESADFFILDARRVTDIDITGASVLLQSHRALARRGKELRVSFLRPGTPLWDYLEALKVTEGIGPQGFFADTDTALEWAEGRLVEGELGTAKMQEEVPLRAMGLAEGLTQAELSLLEARLEVQRVAPGVPVFREGDSGRDLYLLRRGSVTVRLDLSAAGQTRRQYTFSSGVAFGEVALLDGRPRSAAVWAEEECVIYRLPFEQFEAVEREQPDLAAKLYRNIARELSRHLRRASGEIRALEEL